MTIIIIIKRRYVVRNILKAYTLVGETGAIWPTGNLADRLYFGYNVKNGLSVHRLLCNLPIRLSL